MFSQIIYVDDIDGVTPAQLVPGVNICYISKKFWKKLPYETRFFILCHELAHSEGIISETLADEYAFSLCMQEGLSPRKAVYALTDVLSGKNKEHYLRAYNQLLRSAKYDCEKNGNCKPLNRINNASNSLR